MTLLYFFHSSAESQRLRLALNYKRIPYQARALARDDDQTFFDLGHAREVPILALPSGELLTDSAVILRSLDAHFPDIPIFRDLLDDPAWAALLQWRQSIDTLLARLQAAALPAYRDIGGAEDTLAAYKAEVRRRFGMSVEELANDRYAAFAQFAQLADLKGLTRRLARRRFYMGAPSAADMLLAADLYPVQLLDGVSLPIDLMYYLQRVADACGTDLGEGLLSA